MLKLLHWIGICHIITSLPTQTSIKSQNWNDLTTTQWNEIIPSNLIDLLPNLDFGIPDTTTPHHLNELTDTEWDGIIPNFTAILPDFDFGDTRVNTPRSSQPTDKLVKAVEAANAIDVEDAGFAQFYQSYLQSKAEASAALSKSPQYCYTVVPLASTIAYPAASPTISPASGDSLINVMTIRNFYLMTIDNMTTLTNIYAEYKFGYVGQLSLDFMEKSRSGWPRTRRMHWRYKDHKIGRDIASRRAIFKAIEFLSETTGMSISFVIEKLEAERGRMENPTFPLFADALRNGDTNIAKVFDLKRKRTQSVQD